MYLSQWCNDNINKLNKHYTNVLMIFTLRDLKQDTISLDLLGIILL